MIDNIVNNVQSIFFILLKTSKKLYESEVSPINLIVTTTTIRMCNLPIFTTDLLIKYFSVNDLVHFSVCYNSGSVYPKSTTAIWQRGHNLIHNFKNVE